MAENEEKTEAPTPRRRQEARDDGRIAKSQDLTASLLLVGLTIILGATGGRVFEALGRLLTSSLSGELVFHDIGDLGPLVLGVFLFISRAMLPLIIATLLMAIFANWIQVGWHPSLKKVTPKLSFNPMAGIKRLIGGGRGPVQFGMNLLKMLLVGFVAWTAVTGKIEMIIGLAAAMDIGPIFTAAAGLVYSITLRIGITLLILALLDFTYQKWKLEKDLKMSKHEVKEEMKRMEGDPKIKARRRQIQLQQAQKRIQQSVPTADVIVTNPTHYAIALKYDNDAMHAPRVVAKGGDFLAMKIREIAAEHGIPIIERPPLARALYKMCDVGQEIPEQFYAAVAEILAYVYELTGRSKRKVPA
jgi:flagellar biosynthesis protein FlhB